MKRLIIGDIQGCYAELQELVDRAGLSSDDEIIALGDIVDRGPDSPQVLEFFRTRPNARSLMGNHERKHVRSFRGEIRPALSQVITRCQFGEERYPEAVAFMAGLPRFLELPEAILVHGFFEPYVPLVEQKESVIVGVMSGEAYLKARYDRPWYELYDGDRPIIVGHHDYLRTGQPFIYRDRVYGLDTGCCVGGALTGLLLPNFRILSVSSRKHYWEETKRWYEGVRLAAVPDEALPWDAIDRLLSQAVGGSGTSPAGEERCARLESLRAEGEGALRAVFEQAMEENARILSQLRAEMAFDECSPPEQGRAYAARIGRTPLAWFLHRARKGELTLDGLRQYFKSPRAGITFAERLGLSGGEKGRAR